MAEYMTKTQGDHIAKSIGDLAEVVRDLSFHVYRQGGMYAQDEDYENVGIPPEDEMPVGMDDGMGGGMDPAMDDGMGGMGSGAGGDGMPGAEDELPLPDEMDMMGHGKPRQMMQRSTTRSKAAATGTRRATGRQRVKGFDDVAVDTASEEDAPFDEQQDSIEGNEASPAGDQGGDREDETFNVNFMKNVMGEIRAFRQEMRTNRAAGATGSMAKSIVPGVGQQGRGRESQNGGALTRDMETLVKSKSFREINALREQSGDLPRFLF